MWDDDHGTDASRRLSNRVSVSRVQGDAQAEGGGLLRVLFIRVRAVPAGAARTQYVAGLTLIPTIECGEEPSYGQDVPLRVRGGYRSLEPPETCENGP